METAGPVRRSVHSMKSARYHASNAFWAHCITLVHKFIRRTYKKIHITYEFKQKIHCKLIIKHFGQYFNQVDILHHIYSIVRVYLSVKFHLNKISRSSDISLRNVTYLVTRIPPGVSLTVSLTLITSNLSAFCILSSSNCSAFALHSS